MPPPTSNEEMVKYLQKQGLIRTPSVVRAFSAVDRGDFADASLRPEIYADLPARSRDIHLSAPFIYAAALEELKLKPGMSFLNIGSGTCYLSYLVSMLVGELGVNHGVELNARLVEHSKACVAATDEKLDRQSDIQILEGNGLRVAPGFGYDCIYVGAGCSPEATEDYLNGLLNIGGVMVVPFEDRLVRVQCVSEGKFEKTTLHIVCFSPIVMPSTSCMEASTPLLRFFVRPWSPQFNSTYPKPFREAVMTALLANNREGTLPALIPPALWMEIMSFAKRDWFSPTSCRSSKVPRGPAAARKAGSKITAGCIGTAKSVALMPVKAGSVAASQVGCHVS